MAEPFSSSPEPSASSASEEGRLELRLGGGNPGIQTGADPLSANLGLQLLEGPEQFVLKFDHMGRKGQWSLFHAPHRLFKRAGIYIAPVEDLENQTQAAYDRLFALSQGFTLYRIWNFVPQINHWQEGQENYRKFCAGRSRSFGAHFGEHATDLMPAASGLGTTNNHLVIVFLAGKTEARHYENPLQVPAYHYPTLYGPRSPSFARATLIHAPRTTAFISGTAAIRGHESLAKGDVATQTQLTIENLQELISTLENGGLSSRPSKRSFCIYLRDAAHRATVEAVLRQSFLNPADYVTWIQADICRAELDVEIEAVLES